MALEAQFFGELHLPNGTYKTTSPGRLAAVDTAFRDVAPQVPRLELLDVAVSSGVTTLDWVQSLAEAGINANVVATDLYLFAYLQRRAGIDFLSDQRGRILQIACGRAAIFRPTRPRENWRARLIAAGFTAMEHLLPKLPSRGGECLTLVSRAVTQSDAIKLTEADLANPPAEWQQRFDGIRAANILNRSYFSEPQLRRLVGHLVACLRTSGVLVVGRTDESGENHFSLLRKELDGKMSVVGRVGRGADIEDLLDVVRLDS